MCGVPAAAPRSEPLRAALQTEWTYSVPSRFVVRLDGAVFSPRFAGF